MGFSLQEMHTEFSSWLLRNNSVIFKMIFIHKSFLVPLIACSDGSDSAFSYGSFKIDGITFHTLSVPTDTIHADGPRLCM